MYRLQARGDREQAKRTPSAQTVGEPHCGIPRKPQWAHTQVDTHAVNQLIVSNQEGLKPHHRSILMNIK